MKVPVARLQLVYERRRLAAAVAGITFAVVLMLMQIGFRDALFESATLVHDHLTGQLFMVSPQYYYLFWTKTYSERRLYSALGFEGVESVAPLYVGITNWKDPFKLKDQFIFVMGFDPDSPVLDVPGIAENLARMKMPDVILFDSRSHQEFGPIPQVFRTKGPIATEVSGRRMEVQGLFEMGTSFGSSANLITSDLNFLRLFPERRQGLIDIGVIRLKPGADLLAVKQALAAKLPDVRILTQNEFSQLERDYWSTNSPIGVIFNLGLAVGMLVGAVIVYQILYTNVTDHLAEYATLKAMGYTDFYLFSIVLQQSFLLSILGFLPGLLISEGLYIAAYKATLLPIHMTPQRTALIFALTIVMCVGSGTLAMRKLRSADPAEIF